MKQVFLSYARFDGTKASRLVRDLGSDSRLKIWFDREEIDPGLSWRPAIRKAIRESDYFIALLSKKSVSTRGVRHVELREALEILDEFPDGQVFLIPARLEECEPPVERMERLSYADLFPKWKAGILGIRKSLGVATPKRTRSKPARKAMARAEFLPHARKVAGRHYSVALVGMDDRLPELKRIARGLNRAQSFFAFSHANRSTPKKAHRVIDGVSQFYLDGVPDKFYTAIAPMKVDFAVCLTRDHIAFRERGRVAHNYLASPSVKDERVMFIAYAGLREQAEEAGVSFESAIAFQVTSQLVAYFLDMDYHKATRGCPMDFCDNLDDLVQGLRAGRFCSKCAKKLDRTPDLHAAVDALIAWSRR